MTKTIVIERWRLPSGMYLKEWICNGQGTHFYLMVRPLRYNPLYIGGLDSYEITKEEFDALIPLATKVGSECDAKQTEGD